MACVHNGHLVLTFTEVEAISFPQFPTEILEVESASSL